MTKQLAQKAAANAAAKAFNRLRKNAVSDLQGLKPLKEWQSYVVPKGTTHKTVAPKGTTHKA